MFLAWFIGRSALRAAQKRNITPHGPQYEKPYRGPYPQTYSLAKFFITVICLAPLAVVLIMLCQAK